MAKERMFDFCTSCRKDTSYKMQKKTVQKVIRDKTYDFKITVAVCDECGEEMDIPGLLDANIKSIDEQYRQIEGLVSIDDIQKIMDIYNIGKAPLSMALGFGEITITRYLAGQMPSKEYSDIIKKALSSPNYMMKLLNENMDRFSRIGFEIEPFGGEEYAVRAVPDNLFSIAKKELLMEMIDDLTEGLSTSMTPELIDEKVASLSCKAAVKGNNRLSAQEVDKLIGELLTLDNPYHCPHGRPTIIAMTKRDLEKKFKRIV